MARGIMRQAIFRDDSDRNDFVARLGALASSGAFHVYVWERVRNGSNLLLTNTRSVKIESISP